MRVNLLFQKDCEVKKAVVITLFLAAAMASAMAAPRIPKDDAEVLERLPGRPNDPAMSELRRLRAAAAAAPADSGAAATLARNLFDLANAEGDPRYIGYAEAAMRPWHSDDASADIFFVRGLLRQYRHDFDAAIADFARALEKDPQHFGARAWRAAIFMVRANYSAAAGECAALPGDAGELYRAGCRAYVEAATGNLRLAYERLAEMAWRLEDHAAADRLFNQALGLGFDDNFLLAAYADFLLERGRNKEVVGLLKQWTRSDTLLLRLALAERALGMREADAHAQALGERFAAAALRGERLHMGEEARYLLSLKSDAKAALAVALDNWKDQREPRDALIVLEAAVAARDPQAAAPVLKWLDESRFESARLQQLAVKLKKQS